MAKVSTANIIKLVKNKYFITTIIFLALFLFFSNNNLFFTLGLRHEVNKLHDQEEEIKEQITRDSLFYQNLKNDPEAIERFAREQYHMSHEDEDIFVIAPPAEK